LGVFGVGWVTFSFPSVADSLTLFHFALCRTCLPFEEKLGPFFRLLSAFLFQLPMLVVSLRFSETIFGVFF